MHYSRMRTIHCSGRLGGCLLRGGCLPGGCLPGVSAQWSEFLTHTCENITFPQLLVRTVMTSQGPGKLLIHYYMISGCSLVAAILFHTK